MSKTNLEEEINVIAQKWQLVNGIQEEIATLVRTKLKEAGELIKDKFKTSNANMRTKQALGAIEADVIHQVDEIIARLCGEE